MCEVCHAFGRTRYSMLLLALLPTEARRKLIFVRIMSAGGRLQYAARVNLTNLRFEKCLFFCGVPTLGAGGLQSRDATYERGVDHRIRIPAVVHPE